MIDYEKIGKRIAEQRKYILHVSQERMAEELGMYQADISNLEKAKKGSGITDLFKLEIIANYLGIPLETLLFGKRHDQMEKYHGTKMQLKEYTKRWSKKHESILKHLMGISDEAEYESIKKKICVYECGPYMVYVAQELQTLITGGNKNNYTITKPHLYVIYQDEVIGCLTANITTVMQHVYQPAFETLKSLIHPDIFDLNDTLSTLNPYWLLYQYAVTEEEQKELDQKIRQRMDALRKAGENRVIYYVESAYVRDDCRRNGVLRMMLDVLKKLNEAALIWLSLEPTSGDELNTEYSYHAVYEASEIGQINLNASIAEHLGFIIDPKTVDCLAERMEEDGSIVTETMPVRRTAYYLPNKIRGIVRNDGDLLAYAKARKKIIGGNMEEPSGIDIFQGAWEKKGFIIAIKLVYPNETVFAFARGMEWKSRWLGVSKSNPALTGDFVDTMEKYDNLKQAVNSKYYMGLRVAEQLLGAVFFGTVKPDKVDLGSL